MQRYCATCGTLISADDINVDRAAATCHVCKSVTTVDQVGTQTVSSEAPSSPRGRNRREIPGPSHFSVKDDGSSLRISFRWIWCGFLNAITICFFWNSSLVGFYWLALTFGDPFFRWLSVI